MKLGTIALLRPKRRAPIPATLLLWLPLFLSLISCNVSEINTLVGSQTTSGGGTIQEPTLTSNPSAYDFGAKSLNSTSTKNITLVNTGTAIASIGSISLSGSNRFSVSHNCGATLGIASSCIVQVSFTPTAPSSYTTLLVIDYDNGSQKAVSIIGSGGSSLTFAGLGSIDSVGASSIRLNWSAASGGTVSSYLVYDHTSGTPTLLATLANSATSYTVTGLSPNTTYSYSVKAVDAFGAQDSNSVVTAQSTLAVAFDTVATMSVQESASISRSLSCSSVSAATPSYQLMSQSDAFGNCVLSGSTLTCSPSVKSGHSAWTSTVNLRCSIDSVNIDQAVVLSVTDLNHAPSLSLPADKTFPTPLTQASSFTLTPFVTDSDSDTINYTCLVKSVGLQASDPGYVSPNTQCTSLTGFQGSPATFNTSTGQMTWIPSTNQTGTYQVTLTADDSYGGTDTQNFLATVAPYYSSDGLTSMLHPLFADSKQSPGVANQVTTWADISPFNYPSTLFSFTGNPWLGTGGFNNPYRLVMDGLTSGATMKNVDARWNEFLIFFRLPASASDGVHPLFSFKDYGMIGIEKGGATPNRIMGLRYDTSTGQDFGCGNQSYVPGTWQYIDIHTCGSGCNGNSGYLELRSPGCGNNNWSQAAGVTLGNYLGYKSAGVGSAYSSDLGAGAAKSSEIEFMFAALYNDGYAPYSTEDNRYLRFYDTLAERLRKFKFGDIRRDTLRYFYDAANAKSNLYEAYDENTECASPYWYPLSGTDAPATNREALTMANFSNPGCSGVSGFKGDGSTSSPYRVQFDGQNDYAYVQAQEAAVWHGNTGNNSRPFSFTTLENTIELWINPDNSGNLGTDTWGTGLLHFTNNVWDSTWGDMNVALTLKNKSDGTAEPKLYFKNLTDGGSLSVTSTAAVVQNGQWNHLVIAISASGQIKIYRNAHLAYTSSDGALSFNPFVGETHGDSNNYARWSILMGGTWGGFLPTNPATYMGSMAISRTYAGHALTPAEILYHCQKEAARFQGASCAQ